MEEFRSKYPEWCVTRESETGKTTDGLPSLRIDDLRGPTGSATRPVSVSNNRRPGSLGSRSASDSEEERPDSSLESGEIRPDDEPDSGSGFSLGLSVGLRLGLESEPLPPLVLDNVVGMDQSTVGNVDAVDPLTDPGFPVEILPHLFLGNAQNSRDCDALNKHHIRV